MIVLFFLSLYFWVWCIHTMIYISSTFDPIGPASRTRFYVWYHFFSFSSLLHPASTCCHPCRRINIRWLLTKMWSRRSTLPAMPCQLCQHRRGASEWHSKLINFFILLSAFSFFTRQLYLKNILSATFQALISWCHTISLSLTWFDHISSLQGSTNCGSLVARLGRSRDWQRKWEENFQPKGDFAFVGVFFA